MVPSFDRVRRTFAAEDVNIKGLIRTRLARATAKGREPSSKPGTKTHATRRDRTPSLRTGIHGTVRFADSHKVLARRGEPAVNADRIVIHAGRLLIFRARPAALARHR